MPDGADLTALRAAAVGCRGCELWEPATQVVFSAGNSTAAVALFGEQPGDVEDQRGVPFVGPAGRLLQRAVDDAGLPATSSMSRMPPSVTCSQRVAAEPASSFWTGGRVRRVLRDQALRPPGALVFAPALPPSKPTRPAPTRRLLTETGNNFRFVTRGKRRIHATPELAHILDCRPWLVAELREVDPRIIVVLGATAGKSLLGSTFTVTRHRGEVITADTTNGPRRFVPTVHPSSVLRVPDADRQAAYDALVADLRAATMALAQEG